MSLSLNFHGWTLHGSWYDIIIVSEHEAAEEPELRRIPDILLAKELDNWLSSPFSANILEEIYYALGGNRPLWPTTAQHQHYQQSLRERLVKAFNIGELVAFEQPPPCQMLFAPIGKNPLRESCSVARNNRTTFDGMQALLPSTGNTKAVVS